MKYSLIVKNKDTGSKKVLSVFDQETYQMKDKVYLKDIDIFTSHFRSKESLTNYLNEKGLIDFYNASYYIVSKYNGRELYFRVIINSEEIERVAKKVKAGYIDTSDKSYAETLTYIFDEMSHDNFKESIPNGKTLQPTLRSDIYKYIDLPSEKTMEEEQLERELKFKIYEEIKRYKTYRGLYIFLEEYKKYGFVKKREEYQGNQEIYNQIEIENEMNSQEPKKNSKNESQKKTEYKKDPSADSIVKVFHQSAEEYNKEYDEFLSDEEYADAYGGTEAAGYVYKKRS